MIKKRIANKGNKIKDNKKVYTTKQLKEHWQKLKQYIEDDIENNRTYYNQTGEIIYVHWVDAEWEILDKMKDLEG